MIGEARWKVQFLKIAAAWPKQKDIWRAEHVLYTNIAKNSDLVKDHNMTSLLVLNFFALEKYPIVDMQYVSSDSEDFYIRLFT